ncbi:MAG: Cys-Gln thioester bond-forming surface protein, partial [Oscillospiraceae bacterium]|nr:Cys-Gln thioester bond-forming surface protein [Oscillospiraceae bacterium]
MRTLYNSTLERILAGKKRMRIALAVLAPLCFVAVALAGVLSLRGALAATIAGTPSTVNSHVDNFNFNPAATHSYRNSVKVANAISNPYIDGFYGFTLRSSIGSTDLLYLCGDPELPDPSQKGTTPAVLFGFGGTYTHSKNRAGFPSALAYSIMHPNYGAKLSNAEFNELMGFTGSTAVNQDQRVALMFIASAFYEFKDKDPTPVNGSWSTTNANSWPTKIRLIPGDSTAYNVGLKAQVEAYAEYIANMDPSVFLNRLYTVFARIEAMMTSYNSTASGQSTSNLWMNYDDVTKRLTFGYTGYQPPTSSSYPTLSWTITGGGTVTVQKNGAGASISSGSAVDTTAYYTVNYTGSGSVAFTLADDRNFLQGGSIEGYLLQSSETYSDQGKNPSPVYTFFGKAVPYQRMLVGHSKWVKLRCGLTVTGTTTTDEPPVTPPVTPTVIKISALKKATGGTMTNNQFTFTLYNSDSDAGQGSVLQTKNNTEVNNVPPSTTAPSSGTRSFIYFEEITISSAGTYYYLVKETSTSSGGWTVDPTIYHIRVVVSNVGGVLTPVTHYRKNTGSGFGSWTAYTAGGPYNMLETNFANHGTWPVMYNTYTITGSGSRNGFESALLASMYPVNNSLTRADFNRLFGINYTESYAGKYKDFIRASVYIYELKTRTPSINLKNSGTWGSPYTTTVMNGNGTTDTGMMDAQVSKFYTLVDNMALIKAQHDANKTTSLTMSYTHSSATAGTLYFAHDGYVAKNGSTWQSDLRLTWTGTATVNGQSNGTTGVALTKLSSNSAPDQNTSYNVTARSGDVVFTLTDNAKYVKAGTIKGSLLRVGSAASTEHVYGHAEFVTLKNKLTVTGNSGSKNGAAYHETIKSDKTFNHAAGAAYTNVVRNPQDSTTWLCNDRQICEMVLEFENVYSSTPTTGSITINGRKTVEMLSGGTATGGTFTFSIAHTTVNGGSQTGFPTGVSFSTDLTGFSGSGSTRTGTIERNTAGDSDFFVTINNLPASGSPYYFVLRESGGGAGSNWANDTREYLIEVTIPSGGGAGTITRYKERPNSTTSWTASSVLWVSGGSSSSWEWENPALYNYSTTSGIGMDMDNGYWLMKGGSPYTLISAAYCINIYKGGGGPYNLYTMTSDPDTTVTNREQITWVVSNGFWSSVENINNANSSNSNIDWIRVKYTGFAEELTTEQAYYGTQTAVWRY